MPPRFAEAAFHAGFILRDATLRVAPQDEVRDPHGEERGGGAPLEPGGHRIRGIDPTYGWMQVAMKRDVIRRKAVEPRSTADQDTEVRDGGVQSVDRALSIIETLAEDDEGYRLSDLAIRTGLSP